MSPTTSYACSSNVYDVQSEKLLAREVKSSSSSCCPWALRHAPRTLTGSLGDQSALSDYDVTDASATTIWRWLHDRSLKPWQQRSWIFPRDPDFQPKAGRVLDLYARRFEGRRLHPGEYVICADEKSQLQALARRHQTLAAAPGRPALVEFEYKRGGTLAYLAAWDVHHANLFDRVEERTGIEPFGGLVEQVMTSEPYASARRVFWVVDNGSSHAGRGSIERLQGARGEP